MTNTAKQPDMNKIADVIAAADAAEQLKQKDYPTIIPELEELLDPLTPEQFKELEAGILEDGIKDKIVVWKEQNVLVDGHNRLAIAAKHKLPFQKEEKSFADLAAVKRWMIRNQLGRRNLTKDRFTYFLGTLYNQTKQDPSEARKATEDGKTTSEVIGEQFGVAEKTVRRAGEVAKGIDRLAAIKGRLAKATALDGKSDLTKDDLATIGKIEDDKIAEKVINKLEAQKQAAKVQKKAAPAPAPKAPLPQAVTYPVVFAKPEFNLLKPVKNERPPLAKEAIVYMVVADENLGHAMALIHEWGLVYEATFVFHHNGQGAYDGVFSKIAHTFMIVATKGHLAGPKAGKEKNSVLIVNGDAEGPMVKIIEAYHGDQKKLDMRPGAKASKDWAVLDDK